MAATARTQKIRAYRDLLTPALHKRFAAGTFRILLPACYVISLGIGEWNSIFWSWFPLGRAGIRTGLLFISVLAICVLRLSQWHVGRRTTESPFYTFARHWFRFETVQTALHYLFSAWWLCEIYIYSAPKDANIYWLAQGKIYERQRLNERPIYLMSFYLLCAFLQTGWHILKDCDRLEIPAAQELVRDDGQEVEKTPVARIQEALLPTLITCFTKTLAMTLAAPIIYGMFIRQTAWKYTLAFAKIIWSLPKTSTLPVTWPFHIMVLLRSLLGGFLLFAMWDISNLTFSVYVEQPPLKNGKPITDGSNDPNGSLLIGLNSRKMQSKAFAFWELQRITESDPARRRTIYEEIERKGGSTWLQIFAVCTQAINGVNTRVTDYLKPPTPTKADYDNLNYPPVEESSPIIGTPVKEGDIFAKSPRSSPIIGKLAKSAKSYGQSSSPYNAARELLSRSTSTLEKYDAGKTFESGLSTLQKVAVSVLKSYIGWPFRQTAQRRALPIILGSPYSEQGVIIGAINSLTQLALCSLEEDSFGKVQRDIRELFQLFTITVQNLEAAERKLLSEIHWTDVEFEEGTEIPEIEALLKVLRASLQDLIAAFANYSDAMTLDSRIMRKAREAAVDMRPKKIKKARSGEGLGGGAEPKRPHPSDKEKEKEKEKERERAAGADKSKGKTRSSQKEPEMREERPRRTRGLPGRENQAPKFGSGTGRRPFDAAAEFGAYMSGGNPDAGNGADDEENQ